jgi:hypothetical protein
MIPIPVPRSAILVGCALAVCVGFEWIVAQPVIYARDDARETNVRFALAMYGWPVLCIAASFFEDRSWLRTAWIVALAVLCSLVCGLAGANLATARPHLGHGLGLLGLLSKSTEFIILVAIKTLVIGMPLALLIDILCVRLWTKIRFLYQPVSRATWFAISLAELIWVTAFAGVLIATIRAALA